MSDGPEGVDVFAAERPLARATVKDQAMAVIRRAMVAGDVVPGQIFSASALAQRLGVSNSPVRDALMELVHGGIMEVVPNRGFRMVVLDEHDLAEVYELRRMLEVPSMGRLARSGLGDREPALRESVELCTRAAHDGDAREFLVHDRRFHLGLLELLGNGRLVVTVDRLRDQTRISGMRTLVERDLLVRSAAEHGELLDAIVAGAAEQAEQIMVRHMAHGAVGRWRTEVHGAAGTDPRPA
ncbi:GntR family transcriptional regulator [Pseudonocardia alni]|uniref:GntR family transcriptional regulator n=1 Tax=Pseudonocardia alni TaxID=33907 RepID=UPI0033247208